MSDEWLIKINLNMALKGSVLFEIICDFFLFLLLSSSSPNKTTIFKGAEICLEFNHDDIS